MAAPMKAQIKPRTPIPHLWQIAAAGDVAQLQDLLARGADVNACNPSGLTPLMVAAYHGRAEMVKALIEYGAEVNAAGSDGLTAAMMADDAGHEEIVEMLGGRTVRRKSAPRHIGTSADQFAQEEPVKTVSNSEEPIREVPLAETSADQFAQEEAYDAIDDSEKPICSPSEVRTLHEPPDIWDMVHENRTDFKPGSNFFGRLTLRHSLMAAATLLIVGGGTALCFVTLRRSSGGGTAEAPVRTQTNNVRTSSQSARTNKPAPDKTSVAKSARTATAIRPLFDPKKLVAGANGLRAPNLAAPEPEQAMISPARASVAFFHADDKKKTQKTNLRVANRATVAIENKAEPLRSENEKRANTTAARKETGKAPNPESISPPRANATPKGKVIQWP